MIDCAAQPSPNLGITGVLEKDGAPLFTITDVNVNERLARVTVEHAHSADADAARAALRANVHVKARSRAVLLGAD